MRLNEKEKFILLQLLFFLVSSIDVLFIPLGSYGDTTAKKVLAVVIGIIFWLFLAAGVAMNFVIKARFGKDYFEGRFGLISFFKNKYAIIMDILMIITLIFSVYVISTKTSSYLGLIAISLFLFSFESHCVLNGKYFNFKTIEEDIKNEKRF